MTYLDAAARCWAEINLDALQKNYETARALLSPGAELMPVLKANAYGTGAKKVARALYGWGARIFCVACVSEAEEIKRELPEADVLVMGLAGEGECERAAKSGIILTAYSRESAMRIARAAKAVGVKIRVHIKVETGLHRLGFPPDDARGMTECARDEYIALEGLYTHLALRNAREDNEQFMLLDAAREALMASGARVMRVHACDSIGMVRYPERHMDAVRAGAFLYGVCPYRYERPETCLPVVSLKARVAQLKDLPAGECVGYDDEHPLKRASRVATLSAGYADGFPRLNNAGEVSIRGARARVLGLVCMDQMMVDVTDIPDAREGDIATLLGGDITVDEYAARASMNRNEALSRIGRRAPRLYIQNGEVESIDAGI